MSDATLMPEWLRRRAYLTPERPALLTATESLTFAQLDYVVDDVTRRLAALGVTRDTIVALLAGNSAGFAKVVHASARLGAVLVPLNVRLTPSEIAWQLDDCGASFLIYDSNNQEVVAALQAKLAELQYLALADVAKPGRPEALEGRGGTGLAEAPRGAAANLDATEFEADLLDLSRVQAVVYTSGTTGLPKGAMLTYGNHFWSATGSMLNIGLLPEDRWLACLPLFHVGGLSILLRSVLYGIPVVVHESFDAEHVNRAIEDESVTIVSVVSLMLERMLDARRDEPYPPQLRCLLLGGGPAPRQLLERCAAIGAPVAQTYGLTETASQVATLAPEEALRRLGSAGKPLFPTQLLISRDDGSKAPADEAGEILVRGPSVTPGYWRRPEATAAALRDGWLHTGDAGYLDDEGYLYVLDRRDDLIISGGENVYPAEVEAVLQSHDAVVEAGVIGVEAPGWGQRAAGVVVLHAGASVTPAELLAFCRERLAGYKLPIELVIESRQLPRNAAGKLLRRELRGRFTAGPEVRSLVDNSGESDKTPDG